MNTHAILPPNAPFGGTKWSGIGVQGGLFGLQSFTDIQVVHRTKTHPFES